MPGTGGNTDLAGSASPSLMSLPSPEHGSSSIDMAELAEPVPGGDPHFPYSPMAFQGAPGGWGASFGPGSARPTAGARGASGPHVPHSSAAFQRAPGGWGASFGPGSGQPTVGTRAASGSHVPHSSAGSSGIADVTADITELDQLLRAMPDQFDDAHHGDEAPQASSVEPFGIFDDLDLQLAVPGTGADAPQRRQSLTVKSQKRKADEGSARGNKKTRGPKVGKLFEDDGIDLKKRAWIENATRSETGMLACLKAVTNEEGTALGSIFRIADDNTNAPNPNPYLGIMLTLATVLQKDIVELPGEEHRWVEPTAKRILDSSLHPAQIYNLLLMMESSESRASFDTYARDIARDILPPDISGADLDWMRQRFLWGCTKERKHWTVQAFNLVAITGNTGWAAYNYQPLGHQPDLEIDALWGREVKVSNICIGSAFPPIHYVNGGRDPAPPRFQQHVDLMYYALNSFGKKCANIRAGFRPETPWLFAARGSKSGNFMRDERTISAQYGIMAGPEDGGPDYLNNVEIVACVDPLEPPGIPKLYVHITCVPRTGLKTRSGGREIGATCAAGMQTLLTPVPRKPGHYTFTPVTLGDAFINGKLYDTNYGQLIQSQSVQFKLLGDAEFIANFGADHEPGWIEVVDGAKWEIVVPATLPPTPPNALTTILTTLKPQSVTLGDLQNTKLSYLSETNEGLGALGGMCPFMFHKDIIDGKACTTGHKEEREVHAFEDIQKWPLQKVYTWIGKMIPNNIPLKEPSWAPSASMAVVHVLNIARPGVTASGTYEWNKKATLSSLLDETNLRKFWKCMAVNALAMSALLGRATIDHKNGYYVVDADDEKVTNYISTFCNATISKKKLKSGGANGGRAKGKGKGRATAQGGGASVQRPDAQLDAGGLTGDDAGDFVW